MKIIHLTSELAGGAGLAALRLHSALAEVGVDSELAYGSGHCSLDNARQWNPRGPILARWLDRICDQIVWSARKPHVPLFSRTRRWVRGGISELVASADIVHLHWVAKWLDLPTLFAAIPASKPVVLTLHDASFFAGGCHQTDDCRRFEQNCGSCPILMRADTSRSGWNLRAHAYRQHRIVPVPVSQWMQRHSTRSSLFQHTRIREPIHPGIDLRLFRPLDQKACRDIFDIPQDRFVICAGSANLGDPHKGFAFLLDALQAMPHSIQVKTTLLTYGASGIQKQQGAYEVREAGLLTTERMLAAVYSAADVYVHPSKMETFGMTAAEAGACGLPVICFRTGALPEIVTHEKTGIVIDKVGDVGGLKEALLNLQADPQRSLEMGSAGRERVAQLCETTKMAQAYRTLYEEITKP